MDCIKCKIINEVNDLIVDFALENKMKYNEAWECIYNEYKTACFDCNGRRVRTLQSYIMSVGSLTPNWMIYSYDTEVFCENYCPFLNTLDNDDRERILSHLIWDAFQYLGPLF